jgi:hypothetical protein
MAESPTEPLFICPTYDTNDAPPWYGIDEASAWCAGWNAAIEAMKKAIADAS